MSWNISLIFILTKDLTSNSKDDKWLGLTHEGPELNTEVSAYAVTAKSSLPKYNAQTQNFIPSVILRTGTE